MLYPPKYVEFENGLIAVVSNPEGHATIVAHFENQRPVSAGFMFLGKEGYKFSGESLTLRLKSDPATTLKGQDLYYIFAEEWRSDAYVLRLKMICNQEKVVEEACSRLLNPWVIKGEWRDVQMPEYRDPLQQCVPIEDEVLSADRLKQELQSFFFEVYATESFMKE